MRISIILSALAVFASSCDVPDPDIIAADVARALAEGRWEDARSGFSPTMEKALPAAQLEQLWTGLETSVGAFGGFREMRAESISEYDIRYVPCAFGQAVFELKVLVDRGGRVAGLFMQPAATPVAEVPAGVSEIPFDLTNGSFVLPGTLCLPDGPGPFPAAVLVHGSGPNDRDESIGPNAPLRDLARDLALRGVASWRYDKRTKVYSQKAFSSGETVMEEAVDDAVAAVGILAARDGIDAGRVFVIGHSLGGTLLPRIASALATRGAQAAGYVSLAGAVTAIPELMITQMEYLAALDGETTADERAAIDATAVQARQAMNESWLGEDPKRRVLGVAASYWLDLLGYKPATEAAALVKGGARFLFMQGGRDYQVPPGEIEAWRTAVGNAADYIVYPELNHLFIAGTGRPDTAEYFVPGHVDRRVGDDLATWMKAESTVR